jgi:hypothetical protein
MLVPQNGGQDRVLGEVKLYSHSLRGQPPKYPLPRLAADVFVLDTTSLRHLFFKLRLARMLPPAFHSASPRQHALRARERGVCGSR